jgi:hypothetical protein
VEGIKSQFGLSGALATSKLGRMVDMSRWLNVAVNGQEKTAKTVLV